jgi:hypothetical protein
MEREQGLLEGLLVQPMDEHGHYANQDVESDDNKTVEMPVMIRMEYDIHVNYPAEIPINQADESIEMEIYETGTQENNYVPINFSINHLHTEI